MNNKALSTLEFNKITELLAAKAISQPGKERCLALVPIIDIDEIKRLQTETSEASGQVMRKGALPLGGICDIRPMVKRSVSGGSLSIAELLGVGDFLHVSGKVINYAKTAVSEEQSTPVRDLFESITEAPRLSAEIDHCIMNDQELHDDASPKLREIRREVNISNGRVREHLNSIIHSATYKTMLQDSVITIRNGRFCVPIKSEHRNNFQGMIHDQSSTGATLFIEPMSVVSLNNKVKQLLSDEQKEIEAILRKLSAIVAEYGEILTINSEALTELDFIFARGSLSVDMRASEPVFNTKREINIKKGRHPLLDPATVVPTDIYLGRNFHTLLITGPNTGGKTVSLKTLGLFTLMGQAGLHIPAFDGSELAVFDDVFADIGDEQSIEQNLSTFSSHMTNIINILAEVTNYSLVLLDELGAGTDPTEGAALAIAMIEHLRGRGIRTAVTTHYSELKVYALSTDGVENAACEFDVETLRPTYRLLIGIPGKSNAFAISRRLGLSEEIIDSAKEVLSHEDARFEDIITDLEISKKSVIIEKERAEAYRRDAELLKKDYENQKNKLQTQRDKLLSDARVEARRTSEQAKAEADAIIKKMRKMLAGGHSIKDLEEKRAGLKEKISKYDSQAVGTPVSRSRKPAPPTIKLGDNVFINSLNQSGTVSKTPDSNGNVLVQTEIMSIKAKLKDLSLDENPAPQPSRREKGFTYTQPISSEPALSAVKKSLNIKKEIDLRGCNMDEAIEKLDKYLDDVFMSSLAKIEIIHGKGTGVLRAAVQMHLKHHPYITSFRLGEFGEGDTGVTIAELKK